MSEQSEHSLKTRQSISLEDSEKALAENIIATPSSSHLSSVQIEDPDVQATIQPWLNIECYQLSHGAQLSQVDSLNLGKQQIVRETQVASVQKLGCMRDKLCTLSYCTPSPKSRFSQYGMDTDEKLFFMPEKTEFDIYVPAGAQTSYVCFNQDEFLNGAQALNPKKWDSALQQLTIVSSTKQQAIKEVMDRWFLISEKNRVEKLPVSPDLMNRMLLQEVLLATTDVDFGYAKPSMIERNSAFILCQKI